VLASSASVYAEEEIEDLIDIAEAKGRIIAVIEGKKTVSLELRPNETVIWTGARGHLGAFLTSLRFFAISTTSSSWQELPLGVGESENGVVSLSPYIALLATEDRAVGFNAASNRFVETRLPSHDELIAAEAEKYVAVVITSGRAFGFAAKTSAFKEIFLRVRETIEDLKITASKATVRTSDRLLTFEAEGAVWREHRLY